MPQDVHTSKLEEDICETCSDYYNLKRAWVLFGCSFLFVSLFKISEAWTLKEKKKKTLLISVKKRNGNITKV